MDQTLTLWRRATAEGLAAFALVFAGCGAIIANKQYHGALGSVGVSFTFGLIIMVMIYATGHLSGAHINPAVTSHRATRSPISPRSSLARPRARCCYSPSGPINPRTSVPPSHP